jgi:acyl carrier protein
MDKTALIEKLKVIITPYAQNKDALDNIDENTDFIKDLKINSANLVDVILDIEEEFDIEIDNEAMEKMLSVGAALEIITSRLSARDRK